MRPSMSYLSITSADARALLHDDRLVVLATETIGTQLSAVALLDRHGQVLLHTRIRPTRPIPVLADAPPLEYVWPTLAALLTNRIVVSFQVAPSRRVLRQSARRLGATLMYTEWRSVGAGACRTMPRPPMLDSTRAALTEARVTLAALRALTAPPIHRQPSRQLFWRYL